MSTHTLTFDNSSREWASDGLRLHYHVAGDGPPLIMLHGSGPGVYGWANFAGNLPVFAQHFRCYVPDLPGYGRSDAVQGHPIDGAVAAIRAFMDGNGIAQAGLLGNSLGGIVGSKLAAESPERVSKLCMIGGVGLNLFTSFPNEGINLLVDFMEQPTRERLVAWLRSMVYDQAIITEELIEDRWRRATDPKVLKVGRRIY
jgi:pimeloyl-ACP methyl ester carboxylesterase